MTDPSGAPWFQLAVADTGIGMTEEQCAQLFEPYRQADPRDSRRHPPECRPARGRRQPRVSEKPPSLVST